MSFVYHVHFLFHTFVNLPPTLPRSSPSVNDFFCNAGYFGCFFWSFCHVVRVLSIIHLGNMWFLPSFQRRAKCKMSSSIDPHNCLVLRSSCENHDCLLSPLSWVVETRVNHNFALSGVTLPLGPTSWLPTSRMCHCVHGASAWLTLEGEQQLKF